MIDYMGNGVIKWFSVSRADSAVKEGDIVHIIAQIDPNASHYVINNNKGLIVVNPDLLISGTTVVSTVQCMRRSVKIIIHIFWRHNIHLSWTTFTEAWCLCCENFVGLFWMKNSRDMMLRIFTCFMEASFTPSFSRLEN